MSHHVLFKMTSMKAAFATHLAGKWLLSRVNHCVELQTLLVIKMFATFCTAKAFLHGLNFSAASIWFKGYCLFLEAALSWLPK